MTPQPGGQEVKAKEALRRKRCIPKDLLGSSHGPHEDSNTLLVGPQDSLQVRAEAKLTRIAIRHRIVSAVDRTRVGKRRYGEHNYMYESFHEVFSLNFC